MITFKRLKNGEPLAAELDRIKIESKKEGRFVLTIADIGESDYAEYAAVATSEVGEATVSAQLTLTSEPPTLAETLPEATKVAEGEPLVLSVKVDGSPLPDVKWFKNGEPIADGDDDGRISIKLLPDGTAQLEIASADPKDSAVYKMVAVNPSGEVETQTTADVKKTPKKATLDDVLPEEMTVVQGEPLLLIAKVSGYPPPQVQWMKDGRPIRSGQQTPGGGSYKMSSLPDGTVMLEIEGAKPEDGGKYSLAVSNDLGESQCDTQLDVEPPPSAPEFIVPFTPVKGTEGFPVRMEAKLTGYPLPDLHWMKDGKKIKSAQRLASLISYKKPEADGTVRISIPEAEPADAGDFTVIARNELGEARTIGSLEVRPRKSDDPESAPEVVTPPGDINVDEGEPIRITAVVAGNPIPTAEWSFNGEPIVAADEGSDGPVMSFDGDSVSLEIPKAKKTDEGQYELKLINDVGETTSPCKVAVRKIFSAPSFTQKFSDIQQLPGYDAKFMCKVAGLPKPDVYWTFNGKDIVDSSPDDPNGRYKTKRDGDLCALFIRDCADDRAGRYACIATNAEGEDRCEADLQVVDKLEKKEKQEAPYFLKRIGDCEVYEGMTAKFTACASGFPEPDYEWFRNGKKLFPNERIKMEREGNGLLRLVIKYVEEADVGEYSLRAFNANGEATCSAELSYDTLETRPKKSVGDQYADFDRFRQSGAPVPLPDRPIINFMSDRHLTLSWKPSVPIGPRLPVTYHVEMSEIPDGEWKKVIRFFIFILLADSDVILYQIAGPFGNPRLLL